MKEAVNPPWCFGWDLNPHAFAELFESPLSADSSTETHIARLSEPPHIFRSCVDLWTWI